MTAKSFYKIRKSDTIWWVNVGVLANPAITFDKKNIYILPRDYEKMSQKQKDILAKENPLLVNRLFGRDDMVVYQALLEQDKEYAEILK